MIVATGGVAYGDDQVIFVSGDDFDQLVEEEHINPESGPKAYEDIAVYQMHEGLLFETGDREGLYFGLRSDELAGEAEADSDDFALRNA